MIQRFVLDAWAVLALLQGEEPAASRVKELLERALREEAELFISIMNLGEVIYTVGKARGDREANETLQGIQRLPISIVSASDERVFAAVGFKMRHAISYADAFAAAMAYDLNAILVTGDRELLEIGEIILLERLRRSSDHD